MFIVVEHEISDPGTFWQTAQEGMADLPGHLKLHQVLPATSSDKAVCLWEADAVDHVRDFVEGAVGAASTNTYYAVEAEQAMGLPVGA